MMDAEKELKRIFGVIVALLALAVFSYTAFSAGAPELPVRIGFKNKAGKVIFTHETHTAIEGYGLYCTDCHHHPSEMEEGEEVIACGECHLQGKMEKMPEICLDCHDPSDYEGAYVPKRSDAFHGQCKGCHQEGGGPVECNQCHYM